MARCEALQDWDIFYNLFVKRKLYLGFKPSAALPEILQSPPTAPTHTKTLGTWWVFSVHLSCEHSAQWCQSAPWERCSLHDPSLEIEVTPHCSHCPFNQLFLLSPEGLSVLPLLFENVSSFLPLPLLSSLFPYFHFLFTAKHNYFQDPLKTDPFHCTHTKRQGLQLTPQFSEGLLSMHWSPSSREGHKIQTGSHLIAERNPKSPAVASVSQEGLCFAWHIHSRCSIHSWMKSIVCPYLFWWESCSKAWKFPKRT